MGCSEFVIDSAHLLNWRHEVRQFMVMQFDWQNDVMT